MQISAISASPVVCQTAHEHIYKSTFRKAEIKAGVRNITTAALTTNAAKIVRQYLMLINV
jgi:hypothetical protein